MTSTEERFEQLLKIIKGQNEDSEKIQAIEELVQLRKMARYSVKDLIAIAVNDSYSFNLQAKIIWALGEIDSGTAVPPLLTLLEKSENHFIRILSLDALGKMGKIKNKVLPLLTDLLKTEQKKEVKQRIPNVLSKYGEDAIPILIDIIKGDDIDLKYNSLLALGEIKDNKNEIVNFLSKGLQNANNSEKTGYALALLNQQGLQSEALPVLEELKRDGLMSIGQQSQFDIILKKVKTEPRKIKQQAPRKSDLGIPVLERINKILFKKEFTDYNEFFVKTYNDVVKKKETGQIEFKSNLRYDKGKKQVLKVLETKIINTIVGFMNTNGGILLIGVNNDGKIIGLDGDYSSFGKGKQDCDGFRLRLNELYVINGIKVPVLNYVTEFIETINNKEFCIVTVDPSNEPIFLKNDQRIIIRMGNSTRPLSPKEAIEYTLKRFGG